MFLEKRIDDLIEAGWNVVESDFDQVAFYRWRREAFRCLMALLGPEHTYTRYFSDYVREADKKQLLAGGGILVAAREEINRAR